MKFKYILEIHIIKRTVKKINSYYQYYGYSHRLRDRKMFIYEHEFTLTNSERVI